MDQLRKNALFCMILAALACLALAGFVPAMVAHAQEPYPEMVTAYGVSGYQTADLQGDPIVHFPGGTHVTVLETAPDASRVKGDTGDAAWVSNRALYTPVGEQRFEYRRMRITLTAKENDVYLYATPDRNGSVVRKLSDGQKVICYGSEGDYMAIICDDQRGWVLKEHVTDGLSYNQFLAVVIVSVTGGAGILIAILIYLRHVLPKRKEEKNGPAQKN